MKTATKYLSLTITLTFLINFPVALVIPLPASADETVGFPESHKQFLGASSYRAIFGFNTGTSAQSFLSPGKATGRPPRVGSNVQVNEPQAFPFGRSETTIAASGNGHFMVIGWNDAQGFCGPPFSEVIDLGCNIDIPGFSGYGYSSDGGKTFIDGGAPPLGTRIGFGPGPPPFISPSGIFITLGDPSLDVGGYGNDTFYYANLAEFEDQVHIAFPPFLPPAGVVVHSGAFDRGGNFSWNDPVLLQSPNYPNDFLDKEHIAADKRGGSNNVYVTVTNFKEVDTVPLFGFGQIEAYSSADGGETWSRSIVQPDETISVGSNSGIINQGSEPAVAPDGTVFVAWERGWLYPLTSGSVTPEIRVARSTDYGTTWMPAAAGGSPAGTLVSKICSGAYFPPVGYNRATTNDFPRITVAQSGPNKGRVYVTWQDCRIANGGTQEENLGWGDFDTDIYLAFSDDRAETWSEPVLVAGGGDDKIQFWPTVSIQPGGNVDITYYESQEKDLVPDDDEECVVFGPGGDGIPIRISEISSLVDLYYAQSTDGGATFHPPMRVSNVTSNWCETTSQIVPNFGDYNTAVSGGNRIFATWADGRNGFPDVFFSEILTAGKSKRK
ncbi:MAG: sialidase family protein [Desulfobacterales bacterium]|jgi:hypothetical protein